ncbi:MAG: dihydroorotase family protein [Candidatus Dormibacteraeota bacterium]|nr:dihydroorotase family protein [Candidatus Dormibacteraeota bacterium]
MSEFVIRGALVLTGEGPRPVDVSVRDGLLEAVGKVPETGLETVRAAGLWLLPGAIDAHVHSRDPGLPEKEDFISLTRAAAAGGVTTLVDMPNTVPAVDSPGVFLEKVERLSDRSLVDFGLWGILRSSSQPDDLLGLLDAGAMGIKALLGYALSKEDGRVIYTLDFGQPGIEAPPDYGSLVRLAPVLARVDGVLAVHAEDPGVLRELDRPADSYAEVVAARPALAEAISVAALGQISLATGVRVRVVHISSELGLKAARLAQAAGARLDLETCPHYLWLSAEDAERLGPAMKVYPPVKQAADRTALIAAVTDGLIPTVATDHAPHTDEEKLARSWADTAPGSPGVQMLYLSCLELARRQGDPWLAARWVAEGPARALKLNPRKGVIAPGAEADLVLVDPAAATVVEPKIMHSRQKHSALDGLRFEFAIRSVWCRGELVAQDGRPVGAPGWGRLVSPTR